MMGAKEIRAAIDGYFARAKQDGEGYPVTMAGLAVALGMTREELLSVKPEGRIGRMVAHARARVEAFAEEKLFDKNTATGAKFALARNCAGWEEGQDAQIPPDPTLLTDEELEDRIRQLGGE